MDERLDDEFRCATARTRLANMEPCGAAFPAAMNAGKVTSLRQTPPGEHFESRSHARRSPKQRILHQKGRICRELGLDCAITRVRKPQHGHLSAILSRCLERQLSETPPD